MPNPYHSEHDGYLKNYLSTGERKVIGIGREVAARRKDGSVFPMELGINEMLVEGRRMFVGTIHDITDRKKAETELKQLIDKLVESNTELERFVVLSASVTSRNKTQDRDLMNTVCCLRSRHKAGMTDYSDA